MAVLRTIRGLVGFVVALTAGAAMAGSLTVKTGDLQVASATATASGSGSATQGKAEAKSVVFDRVLPGERYDVSLKTKQGSELRLIDTSWHSDEAADPDAKPLDDEDKFAIQAIVKEIKTFTNHNEIRYLSGTSQRAVAIVECWRDTDFHARKNDEVIWRTEVWYFENQAGGWAKVQQQNRVLDRQRFKSVAAFEAYRKPLKWIGIDAGLKIERGKDAVVEYKAEG